MTSIMIMLFIIMYPGARAIIVANKIQQVMTGIFKHQDKLGYCLSRFPWLADYFVLTETAFYGLLVRCMDCSTEGLSSGK